MSKKILMMTLLAGMTMSSAFAEYIIQPTDKDGNAIEVSAPKWVASDFTLENAVELALYNNKNIKKADIAFDKASAKVRQARSAMGSKISLKANETHLGNVPNMNSPMGKMAMTKENSYKVSADLSQPLYIGNKDKAAVNSARLGRSIADSTRFLTKQNVINGASMKYYSWLFAKAVAQVGRENLDLAQAHFNLVSKRYAAEQTSKYEFLRAEVRLTEANSAFKKRQNDEEIAELELLKFLSLPMNTELDTSSVLDIIDYNSDLEADLKSAEDKREDLKIKRYSKKIASQELLKARGERQPTIALWAQAVTEDPSSRYPGQLKSGDNWTAGVSFEVPLIDAGSTKGKIAEAHAGIRDAENSYEESLEQAQMEIRKAALTLHTSAEIVAAQKENMKQAEETVRLAKVRYENGLFTQVDLFDAENAWSNTKLQYYQAVLGHHQARLAYQLAIGELGRGLITKGF